MSIAGTTATRIASSVGIAGGVGLIAFAMLADLFGIGSRGIGFAQWALAAAGCATLVAAIALDPPRRHAVMARCAAAERITISRTLVLALWSGLAVGVFEVLHQAVRKYGFGVEIQQPVDVVWMAPLSHVVFFGALGLALAPLVAIAPRLFTLHVAVAAMVFLAVHTQLLFYEQIDAGAAILVGAALAVRASGTFAPTLAHCLTRRLRPAALLVAILAAGVIAGDVFTGYFPGSGASDAPRDRPSVVLVVLDTVRADHLPVHGYHRDTAPNLTRLAARGVTFERAISTSSWTLPAHVAMFTGRYHGETAADWLDPLEDGPVTLAEILGRRGYATGGFVGNLIYCNRELGIDRGFDRYEDFQLEPAVIAFSTEFGKSLTAKYVGRQFTELVRNDAETVTDLFLDWRSRLGGRPYFAFLNYYDAHALYLPPAPYDGMFGPKSARLHSWYARRQEKGADLTEFVDAYDACIAFMDHQLGRLIAALDDDTILIVTGDHGEQFGEHGLTDHGNSLYHNVIHVPLVVSWPARFAQPVRVPAAVSIRDLPATILDLLGAERPDGLPGVSLAPLWQGRPDAARSPALSGLTKGINQPAWEANTARHVESIVDDGWHLLRDDRGGEQLFDLTADEGEERDRRDSDHGAEVTERLRARARER